MKARTEPSADFFSIVIGEGDAMAIESYHRLLRTASGTAATYVGRI